MDRISDRLEQKDTPPVVLPIEKHSKNCDFFRQRLDAMRDSLLAQDILAFTRERKEVARLFSKMTKEMT